MDRMCFAVLTSVFLLRSIQTGCNLDTNYAFRGVGEN